jgi:hypothetical protein
MNSTTLSPAMLILLVLIIVAMGVVIWAVLQKKRTDQLRSRFGPEYDKAIGDHRDRRRAETELEQRAKRVAKFNIKPLLPEDRTRYAEEWRHEQSHFVDDPRDAVHQADTLVQEVMQHRGYPVGDFEQNAADLSVDHPRVVENYRVAHEIAARDGEGRASTEDLRKAMVCYRDLFEDLLGKTIDHRQEVRR